MKLASKYKCTGCLACADSCHKNAITSYVADDGHFYVRIDDDVCVNCGKCEKVCPVVSGFRYRKQEPSRLYAAWNTNREQRMKSTSGGAFSALATRVLADGGLVVGVAMKESQAYHCVVDDVCELYKLQGSKYQQSDTTGIYRKTRDLLKSGRLVLFQGTACQVAGLLSFLCNKEYDNLITVDIICGGVPSKLLVDKFKTLSPQSEIVSYRDKIDGWGDYRLTIERNSERVRNPRHGELVLDGFKGGLTDRYSCMDCQYNGMYRKADVTIADFWGDTHFKAQHHDGLSLVICHTQKGLKLAEQSALEMHEASFPEAVRKNPRMVCGKMCGASYRLERRLLSWNFRHLPLSVLEAVYANKCDHLVYFPYKVFRYIHWRIADGKLRRSALEHVKRKLKDEN